MPIGAIDEDRSDSTVFEHFFVPKFLGGKQLPISQKHKQFLLTNEIIGRPSPCAIQYRMSKKLEDRYPEGLDCMWFYTTITAVDKDDEWIVVKKQKGSSC